MGPEPTPVLHGNRLNCRRDPGLCRRAGREGSTSSASAPNARLWNRLGNDTLRIAQMNVSLRPLEDRDPRHDLSASDGSGSRSEWPPSQPRIRPIAARFSTGCRACGPTQASRTESSMSTEQSPERSVSFRPEDQPEVTYWVDRTQWEKGIASAALQSLLAETAERPLYARAASDNVGSLRLNGEGTELCVSS